MKILRSFFAFYIQSSIHVALAVTALSIVSVMQYGFAPEPVLLLFILLGTIVGYNFVKYAGISNLHHLKITRNIFLIRLFSIICLAGVVYLAFLLPVSVLITAAIFGSLTILYALPFYKSRNLRSLSGIKIYIIALVWMGMTVLVPLEFHNVGFDLKMLFQCAEIFLFVIALTLPFEIRDLKFDEIELETIPQKIGIKKTKWLGTGLLLVVIVLSAFQNSVPQNYFTIEVSIAVLTGTLLWGAKGKQGEYYTAFWVEGIPILWLILLLTF